ncbi:hypothetical protein P4H61_01735 [Paenibacillus peoriae]|uniref:hypothetical protein n=1 Tax=Paenibacillus peoriae TaxID=59893 RepID=UPI00026C5FA7|nr:hypothetical protein [Paenibacillus peoriae]MEC0180220.1 hypothetical protein [Paenibacillus peoriae]
MASEKTPNLGLNQIDRTSPKTTYFDLDKYLDQNWRAVDEFAGDVNDGVNAIKKRLDTAERKAVTLEPGVQIVHAEKAAPFSLTGLSGRTLVNLLGRWGNLSSLTGVLPYQSDLVLDTSNKGTMLNSLKVTISSGYTVGVGFYSNFKFLAGKYYVAIARAKVGNATNAGISAPGILGGTKVTDKTKFTTTWFRLAPTSDLTSSIDLATWGTEGQYSYFEAVRVYEISASEYAALAEMTGEQIDAKYPYVDSVMPVRNPYAIRYGENLLPPFYEWTRIHANAKILGPYSLTHTKTGTTVPESCSSPVLPALPNTNYYLKNGSEGVNMRVWFSADGVTFTEAASIDTADGTFKTPSNCNYILVETYITKEKTGTFTFTNPMLNIGSTAKPFKPREDSILALQTDLYADSATGTNADIVFERNGQYYKVKKWQGLTLDGLLPWVLQAMRTGFVQVGVENALSRNVENSKVAVKFDGKLLTNSTATLSNGDQIYTGTAPSSTNEHLYVSIFGADSGWGDSYLPSAEEIKAYFMGWKMYDANVYTPAQAQVAATATYNGTGTKYWVQRVGAANYTQTLPSVTYAGYTPYRLIYQLATPTIESIVSEGQLTVTEEGNQIEVGTGIILRERSTPYQEANKYWNINNGSPGWETSVLKNKVLKILAVYKNNQKDNESWNITNSQVTNAGAIAQQSDLAHDITAAYSVTYLMLDKSPMVSFRGSYAINEKTLLLDLVDSLQQNSTRLSVVENKKADKNNPSWLAPTLLNGWVDGDGATGFYKDSYGIVRIRGSVKNGVTSPGTVIFRLPTGYRPVTNIRIGVYSNSSSTGINQTEMIIDTSGNVLIGINGQNNLLALNALQFLAEK